MQSESQNVCCCLLFFFKTKHVFFKILYTFVYFLNPIYMGILFICSCISWILGPSVYVHIKTFFNFSYQVTIYPVDAHILHRVVFTFFCINCREKYVNERYSLGARNIYFP